jgi:hypothetical protein
MTFPTRTTRRQPATTRRQFSRDPKLTTSFGVASGIVREKKLKLVITKTVAASPVTINYPQFNMPDWTQGKVFQIDGRSAAILFPNGAGLRFGALSYWDSVFDVILEHSRPDYDGFRCANNWGFTGAWLNNFRAGKTAQDGLATRLRRNSFPTKSFRRGATKHLWRYVDALTVTSYSTPFLGRWIRDVGPVFGLRFVLAEYAPCMVRSDQKEDLRERMAANRRLWNVEILLRFFRFICRLSILARLCHNL